jgi:hypothetical protein
MSEAMAKKKPTARMAMKRRMPQGVRATAKMAAKTGMPMNRERVEDCTKGV